MRVPQERGLRGVTCAGGGLKVIVQLVSTQLVLQKRAATSFSRIFDRKDALDSGLWSSGTY